MEDFFVGGNKKQPKYKNPNRFNCLDGAVFYILLLVCFFAMPYLVRYTISDFLKILASFDTYLLLSFDAMISQFSILAVSALYFSIRKVNPISGGGYKIAWDGIHVLMSIILTLGIMMLFYFTHVKLGEFVGVLIPPKKEMEIVQSPLSGIFALLYLIEVAVFPAIIEEIAFRGIIMKGFEEFGSLFAVICSAVAFSFMHGSFNQMLLQFIGGLAIGTVVIVTKNFLLGVIMHFVNNSFSTVYSLYITKLGNDPISTNLNAVLSSATIIIGAIFVVVSVVYFGAMIIQQEKDKALGKVKNNNVEKNNNYKMIVGGNEMIIDFKYSPELIKRSEDQRLFYFYGKNRKLTPKSPKTLSYILVCVGLTFAIMCIFFGW